jgi:hypothetical protein
MGGGTGGISSGRRRPRQYRQNIDQTFIRKLSTHGAPGRPCAACYPTERALSWRGNFIPWSDRLLIVPDILERLKTADTGYAAQAPAIIPPKEEASDEDTGVKPTLVAPLRPVIEKNKIALPVVPPLTFRSPPAAPTVMPDLKPPVMEFVMPRQPLPPRAPLLPYLKEGQSFADAFKDYEQLDAYKQYKAELDKRTAAIQEKQAETIAAQQKAQADYTRKMAEYHQKLKEWQDTDPQYQVYLKDFQKWNDDRAKAVLDYQQSDVYKKYIEQQRLYQKEQLRILADYNAKMTAYPSSPEYLAYLEKLKTITPASVAPAVVQSSDVAQWIAYNRKINPYYGFYGTSLESFYSSGAAYGYIELQYWGPLTLDDVEAFEFHGQPPSGEFLKALQNRGIKILDARKDPAVPWTP